MEAIANIRGGLARHARSSHVRKRRKVAPLPSMQPALHRIAGSRFAAIASTESNCWGPMA